MKILNKGKKNIYYWAFQSNKLTAYVASSDRGAVNGLGGFNSGIDMKKYLINLEQGQRG